MVSIGINSMMTGIFEISMTLSNQNNFSKSSKILLLMALSIGLVLRIIE